MGKSKKFKKANNGLTRTEMFVIVSLLMGRNLYSKENEIILEGDLSKEPIKRKIIYRLMNKGYLQHIGNSEYMTLTTRGFNIGYDKIKNVHGSIINPPIESKNAKQKEIDGQTAIS